MQKDQVVSIQSSDNINSTSQTIKQVQTAELDSLKLTQSTEIQTLQTQHEKERSILITTHQEGFVPIPLLPKKAIFLQRVISDIAVQVVSSDTDEELIVLEMTDEAELRRLKSTRTSDRQSEAIGAVITCKLLCSELPSIIKESVVLALGIDERIVRFALMKLHFGVVSAKYISEIKSKELQEQLTYIYIEQMKMLICRLMLDKYGTEKTTDTSDLCNDLRKMIQKDELLSWFPIRLADEILKRWAQKVSNANLHIIWDQLMLDQEHQNTQIQSST